ncbi:MAG: type II toxin-antitoxin system VapC family toxin [Gemmatimonadaceae bacterium]
MTGMVVDASALLAILLGEPTADRLLAAIVGSSGAVVGAPTLVEAHAVLVARKGIGAAMALDALLQALRIDVVPMTAEAASFAREAWVRFGKGTGSPAVLNFGDCLAWGVARAAGSPLLCTGNDFAATDIERVEW